MSMRAHTQKKPKRKNLLSHFQHFFFLSCAHRDLIRLNYLYKKKRRNERGGKRQKKKTTKNVNHIIMRSSFRTLFDNRHTGNCEQGAKFFDLNDSQEFCDDLLFKEIEISLRIFSLAIK